MITRASVFALALVALGCAEPAEPATAAVTEPATTQAPERATVANPPLTPRQTIEVPVPEGAAEGLARAGEALGEALRAGAAAEGDTPCDAAYSGAIAMIEALRARTGQTGGAAPSREAYVAACSELPPAAQHCQVLAYALEHSEECRQWRTDPRVLALRDRLAAAPRR